MAVWGLLWPIGFVILSLKEKSLSWLCAIRRLKRHKTAGMEEGK